MNVKTSLMKYVTGKEDLFTEEEGEGSHGLFLTGKRLVDISFNCLQEAHNLRLRESQSSYDTKCIEWGRGAMLLTETKVTFSLREISSIRI